MLAKHTDKIWGTFLMERAPRTAPVFHRERFFFLQSLFRKIGYKTIRRTADSPRRQIETHFSLLLPMIKE